MSTDENNSAVEASYREALNTKTIPWVDALHKMGRQVIAVVSILCGTAVILVHPDIELAKLGGVIAGSLPGIAYTFLKGRGK